jgi:hypothetical protein
MPGSARRTLGLVPRALSLLLPWPLRRRFLAFAFGYELDPSSRIGLSWAFPGTSMVLEAGARIGHLNVIKGVEHVRLEQGAAIDKLNWITGEPYKGPEPWLYAEQPDRRPELHLKPHASISTRHWIDCTDKVTLGSFCVMGGLRTTLLTHTISLETWKVSCAPVSLGEHTMVLASCVVLAGASLPDYSVLGAMSLLRDAPQESYKLYAGNPAKPVAEISPDALVFTRDFPRGL